MKQKRPKRRQQSTKLVTARRIIRANRPFHKRVLLHPITIFFLLCVGVVLATVTCHSLADSGTFTVRAIVPAPPLTQPALITYPLDKATLTSTPITVTGSCPSQSYVILTRNNTFSGVASCTNGSFSIVTDLFPAENKLLVQDYNITDQAGPTSPPVNVTYQPPATPLVHVASSPSVV